MPKPLVIVESPAKAKTIAGFLGRDFLVESSIGHIRDLPRNAGDVPPAYKGESWARLGVDVDNDFKPLYIVPTGRSKEQVKKLKQLLKDASEVYLATDEDREGESIAWHLLEVLAPTVPVKRMVFHEITPQAIQRSVQEWRELNLPLVDAQETRRLLDRLYGYEVSPVLWKKVLPRLSAGRVQSVATRLVVERERERMRFRSASWWDIDGTFDKDATAFTAALASVDGRRVADRNSFDENGALKREDVVVLDEASARGLAGRLEGRDYTVASVEERPHTERPKPPFITSTLQQAAASKLRFSSSRTMQVAQRLYENGYITYMRTDSTTLSETALAAARSEITRLYGPEYVPDGPRIYTRKVKNAQEAHEAIRPAGDRFRTPDAVAAEVGADESRLYDLIWRRTVASQMRDAEGRRTTVRIGGTSSQGEDVEFATSGTVVTFAGFRRAYGEGADEVEGSGGGDEQERRLPALAVGDALVLAGLEVEGHQTTPPNRYTEASLVKALEDKGVGRPSTYASIMSTIQDRGYVWKRGASLIPTWTAFAVINLLERHFPDLVDYGFTAALEDDLDAIARREKERVPWLRQFYFGNGKPGLKALVSEHLDEIDAREVNSFPIGDDVVVRVGRFGPYIQRGEERASIPDDLPPDELTVDKANELLSQPAGDIVLGEDPATGQPVIAKAGRYGPYVQLGPTPESGSKAEKPRTASLFKTMSLETVTLDDALRLLQLPRLVGVDPADGEEIVAMNGRYGPYVKKGTDSRSIDSEDKLLTITLDEALAVFAEPKRRRGQAAAAGPLREMGPDPATGQPIVVKDGRFGPYVTDGEYNASLRKGDTVEELSIERAAELLAEKRAAGPPKAKRGAKKATKTTKAAKKTAKTTKKAAKKPPKKPAG
ncbi:MAG: topoisomerase [Acidimicrobiaceae bacterium]|nr:topoisomerase [Acidimicrobiaceae bacterium]